MLNTSQMMSAQRQLVLTLWEQGKTPREIATALHISTQRVYKQLQKLGLPSRRPDEQEAS